MAYSAQVVQRARQELAKQKADRASLYEARLRSVYARLPRLEEIDHSLRKSLTLAAQAAFAAGKDAPALMEQAKQANLALQQERDALLAEHFSPDYLPEGPVCTRCGGEGYIGSQMCDCLKELCRQEQRREIAMLATSGESFEDFRLEYYPDRIDPKYGASPRMIMQRNFDVCRKYAREFDAAAGNLLFVGNTGLGKTYLSACIAAQVADKGFGVVYETAAHLFRKMEKARFSPDAETEREMERVQNCDLLIMDDLGTELPGAFVTAALYSLVNDRLLAGKPMLISTNLNVDEIARRYSPQIASRLQGSFNRLTFVGEDIRVLKNRG